MRSLTREVGSFGESSAWTNQNDTYLRRGEPTANSAGFFTPQVQRHVLLVRVQGTVLQATTGARVNIKEAQERACQCKTQNPLPRD